MPPLLLPEPAKVKSPTLPAAAAVLPLSPLLLLLLLPLAILVLVAVQIVLAFLFWVRQRLVCIGDLGKARRC